MCSRNKYDVKGKSVSETTIKRLLYDLKEHHLSVFEQILGWSKMLTMRLAREHSVYHRPCDWIVHEWCYDDLTLVGHLSSNADTIFWASYNSGMRNLGFLPSHILISSRYGWIYIFSPVSFTGLCTYFRENCGHIPV